MMLTELSVKAKHSFTKMVVFTLGKNKILILLASILNFLIVPIYPITSVGDNFLTINAAVFEERTWAALFLCYFISVSFTLLLCAVNFSFMHSKSGSDMFFAIPITRKCLFLSRLTASAIGGIIPLILPVLSAVLLTAGAGINVLGYLGISVLSIIVAGIAGGFFMLFGGRTFESIIAFLIFNIGMPFLAFITTELMTNNLYGMPQTTFDSGFYLGFSPITAMGYLMFVFIDFCITESAFVFQTSSIIWIILSFILLIICLKFICRRKCEAAGNSAFAHNSIPVGITAISVIIAAFLFGVIFTGGITLNLSYAIFAVVGGILCAVILGGIFNRNFKNIIKSLIIGGASSAVYIVFIIILGTGGLGYVNNIPDVNEIYSATYKVDGRYYTAGKDFASTTFTETEDITDLINVHKNVIDNKVINESEGDEDLIINYKLKNGKTVDRRYSISKNLESNNLKLLENKPERMNNLAFAYKSESVNDIADIYLSINYVGETNADAKGIYITVTRSEAEKLIKSYISENDYTVANDVIIDVNLDNIGIKDKAQNIIKTQGNNNNTLLGITYDYPQTQKLLNELITKYVKK